MPYAFRGTDDESQYPDFYQASWIKEIILGKYIKTILDNAFKRCGDYNGTNNVNVILNDGLKYLSNGSFGYCRINKLSLPSSVKAIQSPFMFCYNLIVNSNASINVGERYIYTCVHISFNPNIELIKNTCNKPMVKIPKGLNSYNISQNYILNIISQFLQL